jgi:hypothetical protein
MMSMSSRWTDQAFARLETIVREQEAARARLDAIEREWSSQRSEAMAKIATLASEYDELYVALDAYADIESQALDDSPPYPPPWGIAALPTGFAAPPVQWESLVASPAAELARSEPEPRGRVATAIAVVVGTIVALGIGVLIAAFVAQRVETERVAALPTMSIGRASTPAPQPVSVTHASVVPAASPIAAAIEPSAAKTELMSSAAAKTTKKHRATKKRKSSRSHKRRPSRGAAPAKRIGLPSSTDPLAGA